MQTRFDTIAAIATAPGRGGIAVVRVSGPDAFALARARTGRAVTPGRICFAVLRAADGTKLDEAVVLAFKGPHSYTGEDVVEFQCHGGTVTPRRVLESCFADGARPARRGEFTERAFLNGRLGLDQAESVLDLIDAKTARAADAALAGLSGRAQQQLRALYEAALAISSELEHALDIDEGALPADFAAERRTRIVELRTKVEEELVRARAGKILREGALVVLVGPPNVGKSSLMNALLEENRAIVSDVPGTTRDAIEAWLDLDGWPVRLVDTAGLRATDDAIEAEGVRRSRELMQQADIVLRLTEAGPVGSVEIAAPTDSKDSIAPKDPTDSKDPLDPKDSIDPKDPIDSLVVLTKSDLIPGLTDGLAVSAKTGAGLDVLRAAIVQRLAARAASEAPTPPSLSPAPAPASSSYETEHAAVLLETRAILSEVPDDLVLLANVVRRAAERLGEAIGATYSSDLLERLFARFCFGK